MKLSVEGKAVGSLSKSDASIDPRILDSARREFLARGFEGASLQSICADAGVTTGALYKRYKGKADRSELLPLARDTAPAEGASPLRARQGFRAQAARRASQVAVFGHDDAVGSRSAVLHGDGHGLARHRVRGRRQTLHARTAFASEEPPHLHGAGKPM